MALTRNSDNLRLALTENWAHARHVENLRERLNYLYWVTWAAALTFVSATSGTAGSDPLDRQAVLCVLFIFMAIVSLIALFATLKWTSEFANHVMGVATCAAALHLNAPAEPTSNRRGLDRVLLAGAYLPYEEPTGFMALPLIAPIFLTVGALMPMVECLGFGLALGFSVANLSGGLHQVGVDVSNVPLSLAIVVGVAGWLACVGLAFWVQQQTKANVSRRFAIGGLESPQP